MGQTKAMKGMKVLFVCQRVPYPPNKGEKLRTYHQIDYLTQHGVDVDVLALAESQSDEQDCAALAQHVSRAKCVRLPHKLLRYLTALTHGWAISEGYFYSDQMQAIFNEWVAETEYEAVILSASSLYRYAQCSGLLPQGMSQMGGGEILYQPKRILFDFMDVDSDKWSQYADAASWPMSWVYRRESKKVAELERRALIDADKVFLIAEKERELFVSAHQPNHENLEAMDLKKALDERVEVMGNGIDQRVFFPASQDRTGDTPLTRFLFVGVMDYKPNVEAMLWFVEYVWPSIKMHYPKASLSIVGMNPVKEIRKLDTRHDIQVTGRVDDVVPYFHQADVFVAPFQIARGVQNKILQAMACGLPVLGSSLGFEGIEMTHGKEGFVCNDVSAYLSALADLQDSILYQDVVTQAERLIDTRYSWAGQLQALAEQLSTEQRDDEYMKQVCA
ncbi:TIGR03087 family PEP-CTERM/XrtA system glycosyltransferase [Alteromonas sp. LMIT006]|uniref:TIGR03087 family PEP-CTERM/XrtA system glycosyltransferase n=1 Tax=Alteromonadaceae TaxID=72275 RepID=UPI0020CA305E|nr:TIGR03087 family PEP-CTERM/XrtA system glycosyltransferase [Alteromonas sp. LMIT006]UTP73769.1 TIGR03087 family PEP-CTERM/XrtA system glycosyltransferase [Alteromonas sp. LMIT006]